MPIQPPEKASTKVQALAGGLGACMDAFNAKAPCSAIEMLQALELVRYQYTEAIITAGLANRKPQ